MYTIEDVAGNNLPTNDPNWFTQNSGEAFDRALVESYKMGRAPVRVRKTTHYETRVIAEVKSIGE